MLILHEEIPYLHQIADAVLIVIVNKTARAYKHILTTTVYINLYKYINLVGLLCETHIYNWFNLAHRDDNHVTALSIAVFLCVQFRVPLLVHDTLEGQEAVEVVSENDMPSDEDGPQTKSILFISLFHKAGWMSKEKF